MLGFCLQQGVAFWGSSLTISEKLGGCWTASQLYPGAAQCIALTNSARDEKHFIVRADELLTAFLELQRALCIHLLTEHRG
jgi:hypothetical protein